MPVIDDMRRDQSEEYGKISAINQQEIGAIAASIRGVFRDYEAQKIGAGAGLVGHDTHLNGGVGNPSIGAIRDSARDSAIEGDKDASRSAIEQNLVELQARKGVDASYANPTMQQDVAKGPEIGQQVESQRYDRVRQQGGVGTPDQQAIPSAKGQPEMESVSGGLDAATQAAFKNVVEKLGGAAKGGESPRAPASQQTAKGKDIGDNGRATGSGHSMFGNGGTGIVAPATPGQKEFTAAKREQQSTMTPAGR